jgi:hypothetical protein
MAWQILAHAQWRGLGQRAALKANHIVMTELHGLTSRRTLNLLVPPPALRIRQAFVAQWDKFFIFSHLPVIAQSLSANCPGARMWTRRLFSLAQSPSSAASAST